MKRKSLKQGLLAILVGLLTVSWVGSVSGFPGMMGHWPGFHASEKGYPGWGQDGQDKDDTQVLELRSTTLPVDPPDMGYPGGPRGKGGRGGQHPGHAFD